MPLAGASCTASPVRMTAQNYTCCARVLPAIARSKAASGLCVAVGKPSSNRCSQVIFIQLLADANCALLRSTSGVIRVVVFGGIPLRLNNSLIDRLQQSTTNLVKLALEAGDSVRIAEGGLTELAAIFVAMDGEQRMNLLVNMLNRQQKISMPLASITKN